MTSEFAMQVVKPVVVRISLADTIAVKAPRSGIPTSHRGEGGGDLIVNRVCEEINMFPNIFSVCSARCLRGRRKVGYAEGYKRICIRRG